MTLLIIAIIIALIIFFVGYRSDSGQFKIDGQAPIKDNRTKEEKIKFGIMEAERRRLELEKKERQEAQQKLEQQEAQELERIRRENQKKIAHLVATVDKNNFNEKELWDSFIDFSKNIYKDIKSYPKNRLNECSLIGVKPALKFILSATSEKVDFYNLPNNGVFENFNGTLFDYAKSKIDGKISIGKISVLTYFTFIESHENPSKINEQMNYIILKKEVKNGRDVLAFTSAKNFLHTKQGQIHCSWDYLGEIVYLNLPLLSEGDENSVEITNWRKELDVHGVIRSTSYDIAMSTIIVGQFINRIQEKKYIQLSWYFETR